MKYRRMWLFALLAAALMLLCGAQAIAEEMTPVPAERIHNVTLPEGVVLIGDPVIAKGKVTVYVDDDKTNWTEVLLKAASRDIIDAKLTVDAPFADAAKGARENFGNGDIYTLPAISEGVVPAWFAENYPPDKISENSLKSSVVFAEVSIGQTTYIQPIPAVTAGTLFAWADNSEKVQYEYVQWEINHSNSNVRNVQTPLMTTDMLSAVRAALPAGVTAEIETGGITCTVEDFSTLHGSLPIVIRAPEGAKTAVVYSSTEPQKVLEVGSDGTVRLLITPDSHPAFSRDNQISAAQLDYSIAFFDGPIPVETEDPEGPEEPDEFNASLLDFSMVTIWLLAKEKVPYPYLQKIGYQPVESERLTIRQGTEQISNEALYRKAYGNVHLNMEALSFPDNANESIRMEVAAPSWAVAYGINASGSEFIYHTNWGLEVSGDRKQISSGEAITVYDQPLFRSVQAGGALVYLPEGITGRYGGYVRVISWYDDVNATAPRLVEYMTITHDEFGETVRNEVVRSEQDIDKAVEEVTAVSENAWELVVRHDLQSGENAIHYDLQMEDARHVSYSLDGETVFYIPYPDGYSYEDESVTYQLYHYDDSYQSYTVVELIPTPYGLRFVEDHLSPFVLTWNGDPQGGATPEPTEVPEIDLPQTGDQTHLEWLVCVLAVAVAILAVVIWRKRSGGR